MAKVYGLNGVVSGRQGNNVFAVRNGEQILRKYQPIVENPKSAAQIAVRARLKLISQLSAVFGNAVGFKKSGGVSARNKFTKVNFDISSYDQTEMQASIPMLNIKLTSSPIALTGIQASHVSSNLNVSILDPRSTDLDKVVYVAIVQEPSGEFRAEGVVVIDKGNDTTFPATIPFRNNRTGYVYAYGVRFNSETARVKYGNLIAQDVSGVLDVVRFLIESDVTMTDTISAAVAAAQSQVKKS